MPGASQEYIDSVKDYIRKSRNYDSMSPDDQRKFDMALDSAIQEQLDENGDSGDNPPSADKGSKDRRMEGGGSSSDSSNDRSDDDDVKRREYEQMYGDIDDDQEQLDAERQRDGDEAEKSESQEYGGRHR